MSNILANKMIGSNKISKDEALAALNLSSKENISFLSALEALGGETEDKLIEYASKEYGIATDANAVKNLNEELADKLSIAFSQQYNIISYREDTSGQIYVAVIDPFNRKTLENARVQLQSTRRLIPVLVSQATLNEMLQVLHGESEDILESIFTDEESDELTSEELERINISSRVDEAPLVKLVELIIMEAYRKGVSDIHIEPEERLTHIRFRVDGTLFTHRSLDKSIHNKIVSRIKVLGGMDPSNHNIPQDGSFKYKTNYMNFDLRVSTIPTTNGEKIVMRLLGADKDITYDLYSLGLSDYVINAIEKTIKLPNGILLVTGPTGSGKMLRVDTPIKTPGGAKQIQDLRVGDAVYDSDDNVCHVTFISDIEQKPELYKLSFSDGQHVYADANHQWIVKDLANEVYNEQIEVLIERIHKLAYSKKDLVSEISAIEMYTELVNNVDRNVKLMSAQFPSFEAFKGAFKFIDVEINENTVFTRRVFIDYIMRRLNVRKDNPNYSIVLSTREIIDLGVLKRRIYFVDGEWLETDLVRWGIPIPGNRTEHNYILSIDPVHEDSDEYGAAVCISVDSADSSYQCDDGVVTHNTTTLYSILHKLATPDTSVVTVEDPVERNIEGITQVQINHRAGLDFASSLRSILRQDPDTIMVGEMRDQETATIAARAAITGHFVLSTIHTNDAISTVSRLLDMGVEPFMISSSLKTVIAQRLVRKVCTNCKIEHINTDIEKELINVEDDISYQGQGCEECNFTGYKGRTAVFEILPIDRDLQTMINREASGDEMRTYVEGKKYRTMRHEVLELVEQGTTSIEEAIKILFSND